jgi:membrane-bound ClpP family serine protease
MAMDLATIGGVLLLIAGFILAGVELVLPGFSLPGISSILALICGVFLLADSVMEGIWITLIVVALLGIGLAVLLYLLSKGKFRSPLILEEEQKRTEGYLSSSDLEYLLGKQGKALTDLRPAGTARIDGVNFDVISEGNYILAGTELVIIRVEGAKLIVREVKEEEV